MSKAKEQNNGRSEGHRAGPTRSFDGLAPGPGAQIGPFRIERELGRRAVGVVYLAHDTSLGISASERVFRDNYVKANHPRTRNCDIAKDGCFLMVREIDDKPAPITELNIVINWHEVLESLWP